MYSNGYGIVGQRAPALQVSQWVDGQQQPRRPVSLAEHDGQVKVIYCFQSWCPGCHSAGFPTLAHLVNQLGQRPEFLFVAVQTVFEGHESNTWQHMLDTQSRYNLGISFGHDPGTPATGGISSIMGDYRTGGTPWFILIDRSNRVTFNDFHLSAEPAVDYLLQLAQAPDTTAQNTGEAT